MARCSRMLRTTAPGKKFANTASPPSANFTAADTIRRQLWPPSTTRTKRCPGVQPLSSCGFTGPWSPTTNAGGPSPTTGSRDTIRPTLPPISNGSNRTRPCGSRWSVIANPGSRSSLSSRSSVPGRPRSARPAGSLVRTTGSQTRPKRCQGFRRCGFATIAWRSGAVSARCSCQWRERTFRGHLPFLYPARYMGHRRLAFRGSGDAPC